MTVWVVAKAGWEYDDSFYSRPESGGFEPVKAFRNKEKAEAYAYRMCKQDPIPHPQEYDGWNNRNEDMSYEIFEMEIDNE